MLDTLAKIYDDGGRLAGVTCALFGGDPRFVTAVGLRFVSASAVFRAVADDDTLSASLGPLIPTPDETLIEAGGFAPWSGCVGLSICWAWRLTNHQGYTDGVRLEFGERGQEPRAVVELIVAASAIRMFVAVPSGAA
jgi:hypothetical protein